MNEFERRVRHLLNPLSTRFTQWWHGSKARSAWQHRTEGRTNLAHEATAAFKRAEARVQDFRESDAGKRAASKLHDLRESDTGKKAASALHDLRGSEAGKRAESALTDLRQREPVKKAEESARRVLHDLRSGGGRGAGSDSAS